MPSTQSKQASCRSELSEEAIEAQAVQLRIALDELLEQGGVLDEQIDQENLIVQFAMLVSDYDEKVLQRAVLLTLAMDTEDDYTGRLPIHLACDKNAPLQVIQQLLDSDLKKESILVKDKWGDLPIHTACSRQNYYEVVKLLLESDKKKETIYGQDHEGSIPLHYACRYGASVDVIRLLLDHDTDRRTLFAEGVYGQLPIHIACRGSARKEVILTLLDYDVSKETILREDNVGRLPLHVAFLKHADMDVIRLLLDATICGRIDRYGLENWRSHIYELIKGMSAHERDFMTRERLDSVIKGLEGLLERAFLLEMVAWRVSCLLNTRCQSVCELPAQIKSECRIKSGASLIIPSILSWLEDEPVEAFIFEWKNVSQND